MTEKEEMTQYERMVVKYRNVFGMSEKDAHKAAHIGHTLAEDLLDSCVELRPKTYNRFMLPAILADALTRIIRAVDVPMKRIDDRAEVLENFIKSAMQYAANNAVAMERTNEPAVDFKTMKDIDDKFWEEYNSNISIDSKRKLIESIIETYESGSVDVNDEEVMLELKTLRSIRRDYNSTEGGQ